MTRPHSAQLTLVPAHREAEPRPVDLSLVLDRGTRSALERGGLFELGELYIDGKFESAELDRLIFEIIRSDIRLAPKWSPHIIGYLLRELFWNPQRGAGAFEVAERHYDLGNNLFSAMLDEGMSYTCGLWSKAQNLAAAQTAKLARICQKLELAPGMRVLDIGCGWGNFAHFAATHYGVSVVGLTVSKEQARHARERCRGLPVEILVQDYQDYRDTFDRVVSIEMIEAVGRKNLPTYFRMIDECLKPDGRFVLQVISADTFSRTSPPCSDQFTLWLVKHIFPNGYVPKMQELIQWTSGRFTLEHLDNFGEDYDRTLQAWRENFENAWPELERHYGSRFRRIWLFYLSGCMAFFRANLVQLYQIVFRKPA